MNFINNQNN